MRAALAGLDQGDFTEGHELDRKWRVRCAAICGLMLLDTVASNTIAIGPRYNGAC